MISGRDDTGKKMYIYIYIVRLPRYTKATEHPSNDKREYSLLIQSFQSDKSLYDMRSLTQV